MEESKLAQVSEMPKEELVNLLDSLDKKIKRFQQLNDELQRKVYIRSAIETLRRKFNKEVTDYKNEAMGFLALNDLQYKDQLDRNIQAKNEYNELEAQYKKYSFFEDGSLTWVFGIAVVSWLLRGIFGIFFLVFLATLAYGYGVIRYRMTDVDGSKRKQLNDFLQKSYAELEQRIDKYCRQKYDQEFKTFCYDIPENSELLVNAYHKTLEANDELQNIDFSDSLMLPEKYRNGLSIESALNALLDGRANSWKDCATSMHEDARHEELIGEMHKNAETQKELLQAQLEHQREILENQQKMTEQQAAQMDILSDQSEKQDKMITDLKMMNITQFKILKNTNNIRREQLYQSFQNNQILRNQSRPTTVNNYYYHR